MKKLLLSIGVLLIGMSAFAAVFKNGEKIVDDFFARGNCIKVIKDDNNIAYTNKSLVSSICIDENDMEVATNGYDVMWGKNNESHSYNVSKWDISSDENGNIIIKKK